MNLRYVCKWCAIAALAALGTNFVLIKAYATRPAPLPPMKAQILSRGPVCEAFAETVIFDPQPGVIVPKVPPAAIEYLPPAQRLPGANVAWITTRAASRSVPSGANPS